MAGRESKAKMAWPFVETWAGRITVLAAALAGVGTILHFTTSSADILGSLVGHGRAHVTPTEIQGSIEVYDQVPGMTFAAHLKLIKTPPVGYGKSLAAEGEELILSVHVVGLPNKTLDIGSSRYVRSTGKLLAPETSDQTGRAFGSFRSQ